METRWLRRLGSKNSGFRYVNAAGSPVRDARTLARINALRVPPAWSEVRVAAGPRSAIQAWGFDARGRKQYRYHARAVERRELRKHYRVRQLAHDLPRIRKKLRADTCRDEVCREAVAATVLRLISESFCRVGYDRYAKENGTYGISTLRKSHVRVAGGNVLLDYRGKSKKQQRQVIVNRELAELVARQLRTPGARLFRYRGGDGRWCDLKAREVNDYLRSRLATKYSAKDFRTWGGTLRAATVLAELGPAASETEAKRNIAVAMRLVASELGNTPAICRSSYVHPAVVGRYLRHGEVIELPRRYGRKAAHGAHTAEERALIAFLDAHFPERRQNGRRPSN